MVAMDFFAAWNCYDFFNQYCSYLLKNPTAPQPDVGVMLSRAHNEQKKLNGQMLMCILQDVQFLIYHDKITHLKLEQASLQFMNPLVMEDSSVLL